MWFQVIRHDQTKEIRISSSTTCARNIPIWWSCGMPRSSLDFGRHQRHHFILIWTTRMNCSPFHGFPVYIYIYAFKLLQQGPCPLQTWTDNPSELLWHVVSNSLMRARRFFHRSIRRIVHGEPAKVNLARPWLMLGRLWLWICSHCTINVWLGVWVQSHSLFFSMLMIRDRVWWHCETFV